ncbi:hypothetical protein BJ944DRAFT_234390 [Cunninghamella echinulata]|nr:hypothetical protein BJ944DRAFT_234390 [Cunninghamella echinulata]
MASEQRTLGFLKPDVMKKKDELLTIIKANTQWKIAFEQELILSVGEAKTLYPKDVEAMWLSSHPIYVFILEGNNVIHNWLEFVGPMNPLKAKQSSPQSGSIQLAYQDLTWLQGLVLEDLHVKKPITNDTTTTTTTSTSSSSENNNNNIKKKELKKPTKLKRPSNVPSKIIKPTSSDNSNNNVTTSKTSSTSSASSTSSNPSVLKKKSNIVPPKSTTAIRSSIKNTSPSSSALKNTNQKSSLIPPSTTPSKLSQPKQDRLKPRTSRIASSAKDSSSKLKKSTDSKLNSNASIPMGPSNSKRISNTGGISKNTPAKSVLTGRPRKYSRARKEDQPTIAPLSSESPAVIHEVTDVPDTIIINNENDNNKNSLTQSDPIKETPSSIIEEVIKESPVEKEEKEKEEIEGSIENVTNNLTVPESTVASDKSEEEEEKEEPKPISTSTSTTAEPIEPLPSITSTTDCSQATTESDHDAEVAAATSQFMNNNNNNNNNNNRSIITSTTNTPSNIITTGFNSINIKSNTVESPTGIIDRRLSNSSYSITSSAASTLPRPETPEVDNLRQRFESMSQLSAATNATTPPMVTAKRNSSINPEVASRIKDLKPRDPVGSRVKSMVEFFMDENLHKWEF